MTASSRLLWFFWSELYRVAIIRPSTIATTTRLDFRPRRRRLQLVLKEVASDDGRPDGFIPRSLVPLLLLLLLLITITKGIIIVATLYVRNVLLDRGVSVCLEDKGEQTGKRIW